MCTLRKFSSSKSHGLTRLHNDELGVLAARVMGRFFKRDNIHGKDITDLCINGITKRAVQLDDGAFDIGDETPVVETVATSYTVVSSPGSAKRFLCCH